MTLKNTIGAGQFKAQCLKLIDKVNKTKEPLIIMKRGKPLAKLVPFEDDKETYNLFGYLKDSVVISSDIVEGTGEIWDAEKDA